MKLASLYSRNAYPLYSSDGSGMDQTIEKEFNKALPTTQTTNGEMNDKPPPEWPIIC